jgi:hypothetical protein
VAAWSSPAPDASHPPRSTALGTRKRAYFERLKHPGKTSRPPSAAESP